MTLSPPMLTPGPTMTPPPDADREGCFKLVEARRRINGVGRYQQPDVRPDLSVPLSGDRSSQPLTPHATTGPGSDPARAD